MTKKGISKAARRFLSTAIFATAAIFFCALIDLAKAQETSRLGRNPQDEQSHLSPALGPVDTIRSSLAFTDRERKVLAETIDGTQSVEEVGFYMLMGKIAKFPQLSAVQSKQLDAPAYGNLLALPNRYRFHPIRLSAWIYQVEKMTVDDQKISSSPYWPSEKPIWAIYGLAGDSENYDQPLIIYSTVQPPNLPKPSKILRDGRFEYKNPLRYFVEGVYFKFLEKIDTDKKQQRKYPVVLTWQLRAKPSPKASPMKKPLLGGIVLLGIALGLAIFIFLKKKLKTTKPIRHGISGFPHHYQQRDAEPDRDDDETEESHEVDPDLAAAAKQYRKEHRMDEK